MTCSIDAAELFDSSASFCISEATTANPFPLSPARAASILALRESKLVSSAIEEIIIIASCIFVTDSSVSFTCLSMRFTASYVRSLDSLNSVIIKSASVFACSIFSDVSFNVSTLLTICEMEFPISPTFIVAFSISSA